MFPFYQVLNREVIGNQAWRLREEGGYGTYLNVGMGVMKSFKGNTLPALTGGRTTVLFFAFLVGIFMGCSTTRLTDTSRTGLEQILLSRAVDESLDQLDFSQFAGHAVCVDDRFLECVDKKYVVAAVRRRLLLSGARLVDKPEQADFIIEVSAGALGTDRSEGFIGIPAINVPGPFPVQTPEVRILSQNTQYGMAKLSLVCYDAKQQQFLGDATVVRWRTHNTNWYVLGLGPITYGSIRDELKLSRSGTREADARQIVLLDPRRVRRLEPTEIARRPTAETHSPTDSTATAPKAQPPVQPLETPQTDSAPSQPGPRTSVAEETTMGPHSIIQWPLDPNFPGLPLPSLPLQDGILPPLNTLPGPLLPGSR